MMFDFLKEQGMAQHSKVQEEVQLSHMASSEGDIYVRQENSWVIRTALQWPECKKSIDST